MIPTPIRPCSDEDMRLLGWQDQIKEEACEAAERRLPTPYYSEPGIVIYHADCRDILPLLPKVDLVLTDPPYGVGKKYASYEDTQENLSHLIASIFVAGKVIITPGVNNIHRYPQPEWTLCWWKPNAMVRSVVANANIWEPILVYGCGYVFGRDGIEVCLTPQPIDHPCPKPIKLFRWLLSKVTADLILDPFMGSGTTLVAAKQLGRCAIGIEISEDYCKIAVERLRQAVLPLEPVEPAPEQLPLESE
jgi:DNA modification methylase